MSQSIGPSTGEERRQAEARVTRRAERNAPEQPDALHTEQGDTILATAWSPRSPASPRVRSPASTPWAARRAAPSAPSLSVSPGSTQPSVSGGVSVEMGEVKAAIVITVVVARGVSIVAVSDQIRENVISAVEYGTGLDVVSVRHGLTARRSESELAHPTRRSRTR